MYKNMKLVTIFSFRWIVMVVALTAGTKRQFIENLLIDCGTASAAPLFVVSKPPPGDS